MILPSLQFGEGFFIYRGRRIKKREGGEIMKQNLILEVKVSIPDDMVLIKRIEYEELQSERLTGRVWTLQDLEEHTKRKRLWLQENLLFVPRFKKELEKFTHYPVRRGDSWMFQATKTAQFLEDNFNSIFMNK